MLKQFNDVSTWLRHEITIDPHETYSLDFTETTPNVFVINNPNNAFLKIGISQMPRKDSYEFKVDPNSTETIGRPIVTRQIYIFNDNSDTVTISVFSVQETFRPEILKNMNVNMSDVNLTMDTEISGFAEGVELTTHDRNLPAFIDNLLSLQNDGTKVNLYSLLTELQQVRRNLAALMANSETNDVTLYDLNAKLTAILAASTEVSKNTKTAGTNDVYLNNVTEFSYTASKAETINFVWLMNDGGNVANIKINGAYVLTMLADEYFTDMVFNLKAGDVISFESDTPLYRIRYFTV